MQSQIRYVSDRLDDTLQKLASSQRQISAQSKIVKFLLGMIKPDLSTSNFVFFDSV